MNILYTDHKCDNVYVQIIGEFDLYTTSTTCLLIFVQFDRSRGVETRSH